MFSGWPLLPQCQPLRTQNDRMRNQCGRPCGRRGRAGGRVGSGRQPNLACSLSKCRVFRSSSVMYSILTFIVRVKVADGVGTSSPGSLGSAVKAAPSVTSPTETIFGSFTPFLGSSMITYKIVLPFMLDNGVLTFNWEAALHPCQQ